MHRRLPNGTHAHPGPDQTFPTPAMRPGFIWGINPPFGGLSPCPGQVAYALRTRAPVAGGGIATSPLPLDLHVLGLSLAFILSQDQTLRCMTLYLFVSLRDPSTCSPLAGLALVAWCYLNMSMCVASSRSAWSGEPRGKVMVFRRTFQIFFAGSFPAAPSFLESGCKGRGSFRGWQGEGRGFMFFNGEEG